MNEITKSVPEAKLIPGADNVVLENSLSALAGSLNQFGEMGSILSQTDTLMINNRWYMISNNRTLLSQLYVEHGIVQTLVDQPVDDAFRSGFDIKTGQLDADDIEKLQIYLERHRVIETLMQGAKWGRLYGGGGIMIITDQDPATPLDLDAITDKSRLRFKDVDMWELYFTYLTQFGEDFDVSDGVNFADGDEFFDYYGHKIHRSRVLTMSGKKAPSFIRPRLRGWGMSELERLVRSLNQYMKNQDVIFELLDEAKVDVYQIKGFNSMLLNSAGTQQVSKRIQNANLIKNYNNALVMDEADKYEQKQIQFTGLAEMLIQIRQGIAADLKMPVTKLFGISAAGFNSGEDDIENYNSMIEGEIRSKLKFMVVDVLQVCCQHLFGFRPDDLQISFKPLRVLSAEQEEKVKNERFNRIMETYQSGLASAKNAKENINKDNLVSVELDENEEAFDPLSGNFKVSDGGNAGKDN